MQKINLKFDSVSEFKNWIDNNTACGVFADRNDSETNSESFTGTENYQDADNLLIGGWAEGAARVRGFMDISKPVATMPQSYNAIRGYVCNVGAFVGGSPLCMINRRNVAAPAKAIKIAYNICIDGSQNKDDMMKAAAALFNVVAGFQMSGVGVELWAVMVNHCGTTQLNSAVKIKSAGDPFNILQLVYSFVHPSFFRRHTFALIERAGVKSKGWGGYGQVIFDKKTIKNAVNGMGIVTENILHYYDIKGKTEKEIAGMIK